MAETYYSTCGGSHPPVRYVVPALITGDPGYEEALSYFHSPEFIKYWAELTKYKIKYGAEAGTYGEVNAVTGLPTEVGKIPPPTKVAAGMDGPAKDMEVKLMDQRLADLYGQASDIPLMKVKPEMKPEASPAGLPGTALNTGINSFMGYRVAGSVGIPGNPLAGGAVTGKVDRDPKQDLARWFRSFLYHDAVNPVVYDGQPEAASSLEKEEAGPKPVESHYGFLVGLLDFEGKSLAPNPQELLVSLDTLWEKHWRHTLGFDADASGKQLFGDLERARKDADAAAKRLEALRKQAQADGMAELRLREQLQFVEKECKALEARREGLQAQLEQRLAFIRAMVQLVRLAPDNGYGPTFLESHTKAVQAAAARILGAIGPLAAPETWNGLTQDVVLANKPATLVESASEERARRLQAVEGAQAVLLDPRVRGLAAVCDFLRDAPAVARAPAPVLRQAFDLLDKLGTRTLNPDVLSVLPALLGQLKHRDGEVADRARWVFLRILGVREGKASLEETIGTLAPLVAHPDAAIAEAAEAFLRYHTGQNRGRDPLAWKQLQQEMAAKRRAGASNPMPAR